MVEVKFELDGVEEDEAQAALLKTLRFYQQALGDVSCPVHGRAPSLTVRGNQVKRLAVSIDACCAALTDAAGARVRAVSRRDDD